MFFPSDELIFSKRQGVSTIDMVDMFFINSHAELGEMMQVWGWDPGKVLSLDGGLMGLKMFRG